MFHEPAHSIIELLGGLTGVARHLGLSVTTLQRWRYDSDRGTGGVIPRKYHDPLLALAAEKQIELPRGAFADPDLAQQILQRHREGKDAAA